MSDTDTLTSVPSADMLETSAAVDYFGVDEQERFVLPDGVSYVLLKKLDEGDRRNYLKATNKDISISRQTGDARMKMVTGDERYHLLMSAVVGWNLQRRNSGGEMHEVVFGNNGKGSPLDQFLSKADPSLLDKIEIRVRKMNPWLMDNLSTEDLDKQIAELEELKKVAAEREAGNDD